MKIGILSMQRIVNYGSFWQAKCLKTMLNQMGNDVEFIDILPGKKIENNIYRKKFAFYKLKRIPYYFFHYKREEIFREAQLEILGCSSESNYSTDYDAIFIGSDEVYNFIQSSPWGFSSQLFGDMDNDNICSYAASFGQSLFEDIVNNNIYDELKEYFQNYKYISVRDSNSYSIISKLVGEDKLVYNWDPVLVGDLPINYDINEENYILIYAYDFRLCEDEYISKIREIARKESLKIYCVGFYQPWCDKNIIPNPEEIFNYFKRAKYIITDTFHGSIFAMRLHKQFVTIVREKNKNKIEDLMKRTGMTKQIVLVETDIHKKLLEKIDFMEFEKKREEERKNTENYLRKCLK